VATGAGVAIGAGRGVAVGGMGVGVVAAQQVAAADVAVESL